MGKNIALGMTEKDYEAFVNGIDWYSNDDGEDFIKGKDQFSGKVYMLGRDGSIIEASGSVDPMWGGASQSLIDEAIAQGKIKIRAAKGTA